jgi:hypothetical protein
VKDFGVFLVAGVLPDGALSIKILFSQGTHTMRSGRIAETLRPMLTASLLLVLLSGVLTLPGCGGGADTSPNTPIQLKGDSEQMKKDNAAMEDFMKNQGKGAAK